MPLAASLFLVCLAASLGSSFVLARALDRIGVRLGMTDAVIGMLTALGADAPEISTAAAAVLSKHDEIGVGVVLGSNVVNLAALLGIGALLAGRVHLGRRAAMLEGATAIAVAAARANPPSANAATTMVTRLSTSVSEVAYIDAQASENTTAWRVSHKVLTRP